MPAHCLTRGLGLREGKTIFESFVNPLSNKIPKSTQPRTLISPMVAHSGSSKRPTCPKCSKPTRICLCNRLKTPSLNNSVSVTILQHTLEKRHPLNSTRIATIGLKNVDVVTVSDVNFQAQFVVSSIGGGCEMGSGELESRRQVFDEMPDRVVGDIGSVEGWLGRKEEGLGESGATSLGFTIDKHGAIRSYSDRGTERSNELKLSLDELLASDVGFNDGLREGFVVRKIQRERLDESRECDENQEFELVVRPGSVLLFPSERAVGIEAVDFEVKNLIVLDGTWAKAKRMYSENPWLQLLPHVRLDVDKLSLYSEVRHQPRAGYLSTIESIVYALKAVGERSVELDSLLDVFESMVGDQRRCKDERLKARNS